MIAPGGEADGDRRPGEAVARAGGEYEVGEDRDAGIDVGSIDGGVRQPMEEHKPAIDGDGTSNTDEQQQEAARPGSRNAVDRRRKQLISTNTIRLVRRGAAGASSRLRAA